MTAAQQAIDSAIKEIERIRRTFERSNTAQVRSDDKRQAAKATALAYFNSHRKVITAILGEDHIKEIDQEYRALLASVSRATLRSKCLATFKSIRKLLIRIQSDDAITLAAEPAAPQAATSDSPPAFTPLVADVKMQRILVNRWQECGKCVDAGAPLAAVVMMGGLLEGLLLARVNQMPDKKPVFTAASTPKESKTGNPLRLNEWGLKDYLGVAHELGWISRTTKDVGEVVRDYRNYIHPQKEHSHGISISAEDARTMWEIALKNVARQILK